MARSIRSVPKCGSSRQRASRAQASEAAAFGKLNLPWRRVDAAELWLAPENHQCHLLSERNVCILGVQAQEDRYAA